MNGNALDDAAVRIEVAERKNPIEARVEAGRRAQAVWDGSLHREQVQQLRESFAREGLSPDQADVRILAEYPDLPGKCMREGYPGFPEYQRAQNIIAARRGLRADGSRVSSTVIPLNTDAYRAGGHHVPAGAQGGDVVVMHETAQATATARFFAECTKLQEGSNISLEDATTQARRANPVLFAEGLHAAALNLQRTRRLTFEQAAIEASRKFPDLFRAYQAEQADIALRNAGPSGCFPGVA